MKTYSTATALRAAISAARRAGKTVAFVPTMGNLHDGHIELVRRARREADVVVVSIFINPLQFAANEDLSTYPRTLTADKEKLFAEGVQFLFQPPVEEIYPEGMDNHCKVSVPAVSEKHCGASRPGHFTGVATIVNKLFNIVQPDVAVFGEKDFQQLSVIRKMARDLCMPINIIGVATARAKDGLALSSRNGYLDEQQRKIAPVLHQILQETREAIACDYDSYSVLEAHAEQVLRDAGFEPDYFNICDARSLGDVNPDTEEVVILAAAKLGSTRLIDNVTLTMNPSADWGMLAAN